MRRLMIILAVMFLWGCSDVADDLSSARLTFNYGGGRSDVAVRQVKVGNALGFDNTPQPQITGLTFVGWYSGGDLFNPNAPVTADKTLHGRWSAAVRFVDSDDNQLDSKTVIFGDSLKTFQNIFPPIPDTSLIWWRDTAFGGNHTVYTDEIPSVTRDITLKTVWGHNIEFQDKEIITLPVEHGKTFGENPAAFQFPIPTGGINFEGWFTNPNGTGNEIRINTPVVVAERYYARWSTVSVTFNFNNESEQVLVENGKTIPTSSIPVPAREGYIFVSWRNRADGADFNAHTPVEINMVLDAVWGFRVTYIDPVSGWSIAKAVPTGEYAPNELISGPNNEFAGWFTNAGQSLTNTPINSATVFEARWNSVVTFDPIDGFLTEPNTRTVRRNDALGTLPAAGHTDFNFVEWRCGGEPLSSDTPIERSITCEAVFARGTRAEPFTIADPQGLQNMSADKHYRLLNDIDLTGVAWQPVGDDIDPFTGSFDGGGFRVTGVEINSNGDNVGFFGVVRGDCFVTGEIKNFGMVLSENGVRGRDFVGGIAGLLDGGCVKQSYVTRGKISGQNNVGGIVGSVKGEINDSYSTADVFGRSQVGGVAGILADGKIANVYSSGIINGTVENVGGVCGLADGTVEYSAALNPKVGDANINNLNRVVGGFLAGGNAKSNVALNTMQISVRINSINGDMGAGRSLVRLREESLYNAPAMDELPLNWNFTRVWKMPIGGFPELQHKNVHTVAFINENSLTELFHIPNGGAISVTAVPRPPIHSEWNTSLNGEKTFSAENKVYGDVTYFALHDGDGFTEDTPKLIRTADDMENIRMDGHYKLINSINLPTGLDNRSPFLGTFDGGGHTITIIGGASGLFNVIGRNGVLQNLNVRALGVSSSGGDVNVGIIAGYLEGGLVKNVGTSGIVTGRAVGTIGGIAGRVSNGGRIKNSFSTAALTNTLGIAEGMGGIAGLIRDSESMIENCYYSALSEMRGVTLAGGIVGQIFGATVTNSYSQVNIICSGDKCGGVAGEINNEGVLTHSYFSGNITANDYVGGVVGLANRGFVRFSGNLGIPRQDIAARIWVNNGENVGLIAGNAVDFSSFEKNFVRDNMDINKSTFDLGDIGTDGNFLHFDDLKKMNTYISAGWSFGTDETRMWKIDEGRSYPYLYFFVKE